MRMCLRLHSLRHLGITNSRCLHLLWPQINLLSLRIVERLRAQSPQRLVESVRVSVAGAVLANRAVAPMTAEQSATLLEQTAAAQNRAIDL